MSRSPILWAPWRNAYLRQARRRAGCIFCEAARSRQDRARYVVYRGQRVYVLLNRYPYSNGHVMVALARHVGRLRLLSPRERAELMDVTSLTVDRLTSVLRPQGFNVGLNIGRAAGASIMGHLHMHIVPRWVGDTNFISTTGRIKVISQSLDSMYEELHRSFAGS